MVSRGVRAEAERLVFEEVNRRYAVEVMEGGVGGRLDEELLREALTKVGGGGEILLV